MSESFVRLNRRLYFHNYPALISPARFKLRFQLLYLLVTVNIIFFLIVYNRLILITSSSIKTLILKNTDTTSNQQSSSICFIPRFDPWDQTVAKTLRIKPLYRCPTDKQNLINVVNYTQLFINQTVNRTSFRSSITHCVYMKVYRNFTEEHFRDWTYSLSEPILIIDGSTKPILDADFVLTRCHNDRTIFFAGETFW
jgi:hypothetical protein